MGHISKKNFVDVTFLLLFSTIFRYQPIRCADLIEFKNYSFPPLNRFCQLPAQFLLGSLLNNKSKQISLRASALYVEVIFRDNFWKLSTAIIDWFRKFEVNVENGVGTIFPGPGEETGQLSSSANPTQLCLLIPELQNTPVIWDIQSVSS